MTQVGRFLYTGRLRVIHFVIVSVRLRRGTSTFPVQCAEFHPPYLRGLRALFLRV